MLWLQDNHSDVSLQLVKKRNVIRKYGIAYIVLLSTFGIATSNLKTSNEQQTKVDSHYWVTCYGGKEQQRLDVLRNKC